MNVGKINRYAVVLLAIISVALVVVMSWGLNRLRANYDESFNYFKIRETISGSIRITIEDYLNSGNSERLVAANAELSELSEQQIQALPDELEKHTAADDRGIAKNVIGQFSGSGKAFGQSADLANAGGN